MISCQITYTLHLCLVIMSDYIHLLNPAPPHPVVIPEIATDSQPPWVDDEEDNIPMFPNRYVDIDNKAIGGDFEMPAAKQKFMKVLHNSAEKYANLNFSIYF